MKKILLILILTSLFFWLTGCGDTVISSKSKSSSTSDLVDGTEPPAEEVPEDETETAITPSFMVATDGDDWYFSDHDRIKLWETGNIEKSGSMEFSLESELLTMDESGETVSSLLLAEIPAKIHSNYFCIEYQPEKVLELSGGFSNKIHSVIYRDNQILSDWNLNQWECKGIIQAHDSWFAIDQLGNHHVIDGPAENIEHVQAGGFYTHDLNLGSQRIYFNGFPEAYDTNAILNADSWIKYDGTFYSSNGFTWNDSHGLIENATALYDFAYAPYPVTPELPNGEAPTLESAGIYNGKLYFVEMNSGWVFIYDPVSDVLNQSHRVFIGDGTRNTGQIMKTSLKQITVSNYLYFSNDGIIYSLNLDTGMINIFYNESGEVVKYG